jgi:uncharacterized small protein (DUF1192 family)
MHRILVLALLLAPTLALAQQSSPSSPPKDRKDYLIEAVESQRNDALSKLAVCYADANGQIAALNAQIASLQAQIAKASAPTPPTAPPQ